MNENADQADRLARRAHDGQRMLAVVADEASRQALTAALTSRDVLVHLPGRPEPDGGHVTVALPVEIHGEFAVTITASR